MVQQSQDNYMNRGSGLEKLLMRQWIISSFVCFCGLTLFLCLFLSFCFSLSLSLSLSFSISLCLSLSLSLRGSETFVRHIRFIILWFEIEKIATLLVELWIELNEAFLQHRNRHCHHQQQQNQNQLRRHHRYHHRYQYHIFCRYCPFSLESPSTFSSCFSPIIQSFYVLITS